jgi:hypothetical protein
MRKYCLFVPEHGSIQPDGILITEDRSQHFHARTAGMSNTMSAKGSLKKTCSGTLLFRGPSHGWSKS